MRRDKGELLLRCLFMAALVLVPEARAQEETMPPASNLQTKVLDLVFRVEDIGGKAVDLQVKELGGEVHIEMASDVLFDFDKADLLPKAEEALKRAADIIRQRGKGTIRVEGHTDSKGSEPYNQRLSERRAASVKTWLVEKEGLTSVQFATRGFGAKKPVASNQKPDGSDDPDGRQKNRRVEIIFKQ